MPEVEERLQKLLAEAGVASRRKAELLIQEGRVTVNGRIVTQLGVKVNPAADDVRVDGQKVKMSGHHVYILLNKPRGVVSSMEDARGHKALGDLVQVPQRVFPVGRLDATSEGLVLLTDDGELANLLTHPRYEHEKEYRALVNGVPSEATLEAWRRGVVLEGKRTAPAKVDVIRQEKDSTLLRVIMHEGRKRQLREVAAMLGHPVRQLQRIRLGPLHLGLLKAGEWRHLAEREVEELLAVKRRTVAGKEAGAGSVQTRKGQPAASAEPPLPRGKRPDPGGKRTGTATRPGPRIGRAKGEKDPGEAKRDRLRKPSAGGLPQSSQGGRGGRQERRRKSD